LFIRLSSVKYPHRIFDRKKSKKNCRPGFDKRKKITVCLSLWIRCFWRRAQSLFPSFNPLFPETNLSLTLIKFKILQSLYKTPQGEHKVNRAAGDNLSSPSPLLPPHVFPAFLCLSLPALLLSRYLLTQPSLHRPIAPLSDLLPHPLLCVSSTFQEFH